MVIIGEVNEILDKSKPEFKKQVAIVSDSMNRKNTWAIEFRKHMSDIAKALHPGDRVKVTVFNDFKKDKYSNCYNNVVAEQLERI